MALMSISSLSNIPSQTWCVPLLAITGKAAVNHGQFHLRIELADKINNRRDTLSDDEKNEKREEIIFCRVCFAAITANQEAISRNGRHSHVFFNPIGIVFETRCFARAPGCQIHGQAASDFSWFSGYQWQYGFCATCLTHLGWWFSNKKDGFFNLITSRLTD